MRPRCSFLSIPGEEQMKSVARLALLCALFAFSTTAACAKEAAKDEKAAAKPINKICPVEGGEVDPAATLEHEGKIIGFCCAGCDEEFKKDPAKYMAIIAKETAAEDAKAGKKDGAKGEEKKPKLNATCPVSGDDADPTMTTEYKGRTLAFCCEDCIKEFEKNPKKYLAKLEKQEKEREKEAADPANDKGEKSEK